MMADVEGILLWGFVATILMTTIPLGSQGLGLSRLSPPFLFGTAVTGRLRPAYLIGYILYASGGWCFTALYGVLFAALGRQSWWVGAAIGVLHATFLLTALMHVPYIHPRMASEYDQPRADRALEPPGFLGLNYGRQTPLVTLLGHIVYGAVLGAGLPPL